MRYTLLISLIVISCTLFAVPMTQEQARQVAQNWTAKWAPQDFTNRTIEKTIPFNNRNETQIYLFQYRDGFVLTSADDAIVPVLGYGYNTKVGEIGDNPAYDEYIAVLQQEITEITQQRLDNSQTAAEWQSILNNTFERNDTRSVSPLVASKWNQDWPYNMYCPSDAAGPGGKVYAGCVATAMGQVMKYWNWPPTGSGSHSYYAQGYGTQTANFGNTTYQWTQMPNQVHEPNDAVARLLYHCGVAVDMMYAPDGSGAYSQMVPGAMIQYFKYNSATQQKSKSNYTSANWEALLKTELDNARPMYYSGSGPGGGHAFVCDGYQGENYFHFNWGWSGSSDGYFYVSNLNPSSTFNNYQGAIINISPINYSMSNVQLALLSQDCSVGDNTTLSVTTYPIMPSWNVQNVSFIVEYDADNVDFMDYNTTGTMLDGATVTHSVLQPGRLLFEASTVSALSGAGTLIKANFRPMLPGSYVFNVADIAYNQTVISQTAASTINVTALITVPQNSVIDLLNALYINLNSMAVIPLTTTFILPTWGIQSADFVITYPADKLGYEGYDAVGCLTEFSDITVSPTTSGVLSFSIDFNGIIAGSGNFIKLYFRAIGNSTSASLATITVQDFYYGQTLVQNLSPGYVILLPVMSNNEAVSEPVFNVSVGPNPFMTETKLVINNAKADAYTEIKVYNLKGQEVKTLFKAEAKGTSLNLVWDGKDSQNRESTAGIYFIKIKTDTHNSVYKVLKLR